MSKADSIFACAVFVVSIAVLVWLSSVGYKNYIAANDRFMSRQESIVRAEAEKARMSGRLIELQIIEENRKAKREGRTQ